MDLATLEAGNFPLMLGGDHSLAVGTFRESPNFTQEPKVGICGSMLTAT